MKMLFEYAKLAVLVLYILIISIATPFDDGNPKYFDPYE